MKTRRDGSKIVPLQRWGCSPVKWRVLRDADHEMLRDLVLPADALTDKEIQLAIEEATCFKQYYIEHRANDGQTGRAQFEQNIITDLQAILEKRSRAS